MEDDHVKKYIDVAHTMFKRGEFDAAEKVLNAARDTSLNDAETRQIEDFLSHYKKELSKVKSNYLEEQHSKTNDGNGKDDNVEKELQDCREHWVLYNSLSMRAYLFTMGIQVFASKPNFRSDVDFNEIQYQLQYLINLSNEAFKLGQYDDAEKYMKIADDMYSDVTFNKQKDSQNNILNDDNSKGNKDSDQNKPGGNTDTDSTLKSYKITVIGDDVDVMKCLKVADTALLAKDFKKAERWLLKSERIRPTDYAKQLLKKLEIARREATVAATRPPPAEVTETAEEAKEEPELPTVSTPQERAEMCLDKAQKAYEESDDPLKQHVFTTKKQDHESVNRGSIDQADNNKKPVDCKEFEIPGPSYVDSNSETAFASKFDNEYPYRAVKDNNMDKVGEFLKKGRMALAKHKFAVATEFALKAEELFSTVRGKALISDIKLAENFNRDVGVHRAKNDKDFTPKPQHTDNATQTKSLKETGEKCLLEFHKEFNKGNLDKAEEILVKTEKLHPSADLNRYLHWIQTARSKQQSDKQFDIGCPELDSKGSPKYEDINRMDLNKEQQDKCTETTKDTYIMRDLNTCKFEQEAQLCIDSARTECDKGNLDKAEEILLKVKELCPAAEKEVNIELRNIQSQRFWKQTESDYNNQTKTGDKQPPESEANKDQLDKCINMAKEAFSEGDLKKAEKICQKAIRMSHNIDNYEIRNLMSNIREEQENRIVEDKHQTKPPKEKEKINVNIIMKANTCVKLAEQAYNDRNLEKAKHLFKKSIRIHQTDYAMNFLCKVENEIEKIKKSTVNIEKNNDNKTEKPCIETEKKITAEEHINKALEAIDDKHFYVADIFLNKAERIYPTEHAKELLKIVHDNIKTQIGASRDKSPGAETKQQAEFQKQANDYIALATDMFNVGDYAGARQKALISDSFVPSSEAKMLLDRIIDTEMAQRQCCTGENSKSAANAKKGKNKINSQSESDKIFKADTYLEIAEQAFRYGELEKAEEYVKKSIYFNSKSVKAKKMHLEIQNELNKNKGLLSRGLNSIKNFVHKKLS